MRVRAVMPVHDSVTRALLDATHQRLNLVHRALVSVPRDGFFDAEGRELVTLETLLARLTRLAQPPVSTLRLAHSRALALLESIVA
jgi:hypothetical protein